MASILPAGVGPARGVYSLSMCVPRKPGDGLLALLLVLAGCLPFAGGGEARRPPADLVFRGGAVYTLMPARPWARAVAVRGTRIVYVGDEAGLAPHLGPRTRVVDLAGRMLLPGFEDAHIHPDGGMEMEGLLLHDCEDAEEVYETIGAWAEAHPEVPWIEGDGWSPVHFRGTGTPDLAVLDELVPDRPALIYACDGHTAIANAEALALAGIDGDTPDPPHGRIGRNPATGEPDGVLYEYAIDLVERFVPQPPIDARVAGYRETLARLRADGITAMVDAGAKPESVEAFAELARRGELTVRTVLSLIHEPNGDDERQVEAFVARRAAHAAGNPRATSVKLMLDGIIEQHTGALLDPYLDRPGERGEVFIEPERLARLVTRLDALGFQVHVHAIGDRAIRVALDAFEVARARNGARDARHHLAHVQLVHPDDLPRFAALGVAANMTPVWAVGDEMNLGLVTPWLGPARAEHAYPHRSLLAAGARLVFGSDWPVSTHSPIEGIEAAVTRRNPGGLDEEGEPDEAWLPAECLSLEEAIAAYTRDGAWLSFEEGERGSIEVGRLADLVVLGRNLFETPPLEIHEVPVEMTVFDGRIVFERE